MRQLFAGAWPHLVLFDLDGTLVDSVPDLAQAVDQMLLQLGRSPAGVDKVRIWVGNGAAMLVRRALADDFAPVAIDDGVFSAAYELFLQAYEKSVSARSELYPGVRECLEGLQKQGVTLGLITNKPIAFTNTLLEGLGLQPYFRVVYGGDSLSEKNRTLCN